MHLVVGRVGRAHGIRGDVAVEVRTDAPDERFAPGSELRTESGRTLTVSDARWHSGRLLVRFEGFADRNAAEQVSGELVYASVSEDESTGDPEEFFDHQLVGMQVRDTAGSELGEVTDVLHLPAQDVLAVRTAGAERADTGAGGVQQGSGASAAAHRGEREVLVPFVAAVVPTVDPANRIVVVDPPEGLF